MSKQPFFVNPMLRDLPTVPLPERCSSIPSCSPQHPSDRHGIEWKIGVGPATSFLSDGDADDACSTNMTPWAGMYICRRCFCCGNGSGDGGRGLLLLNGLLWTHGKVLCFLIYFHKISKTTWIYSKLRIETELRSGREWAIDR